MFGVSNAISKFSDTFSPKWVNKVKSPNADRDIELQKKALQVLNNQDGSYVLDNSMFVSHGLAVEVSFQTSTQLVNEYRSMGLDADVDMAVDDIVNAAVVSDDDDDVVVANMENIEISDDLKEKVSDEFRYLMDLLDMNRSAYDKFKQWYIDGRQYYQIMVNEGKPKDGIQKLVLLDPRALKKVKSVDRKMDTTSKLNSIISSEVFYLYNPIWVNDNTADGSGMGGHNARTSAISANGSVVKLSENSIAYVHSGVLSSDGSLVFSHLEKARKPLNNLKSMRDGAVIYRITRSPERRAFYVDTGTLPKKAAEEFVQGLMNRHKSKMIYDPASGRIKGQPYQQSMVEDFWLPRQEGGRGTEITTLQGGQNLGEITDILYFQKLLFRSLNVPADRLEDSNAGILIGGRGTEITRDEWKFNKFIQRLRRKYCSLFDQLLRTHLILKGVCSSEEWEELFNGKIKYEFKSDAYLKEQEENDKLLGKVAALAQADEFVGKYYTREWVMKNIMRFDEDEIKAELDGMKAEKTEMAEFALTLPTNDDGDIPQLN